VTGAWRRLGLLPLDVSSAPWACTHTALPAPEPAGAGRWTVYLSARDGGNRARIGRAVLTLEPFPSLGPLDGEPVLNLGQPGAFDEDGVTVSCVVHDGRRRHLYYTGWQRGAEGGLRFTLTAGLAVDEGDGSFRRVSPVPVLERTGDESSFTASPFVLRERDRWRMWYVAGSSWRTIDGRQEPCYDIRYAESLDGISWSRMGACIDHTAEEYAFGRPWVVRDADRYRMWFSVRGERYRIGAAESSDGVTWLRTDDTSGLRPSEKGWESEMVAYPAVVDHTGRRYLLYNGNGYGKTGIGLAVWEPG
jgi:hypothetical protein